MRAKARGMGWVCLWPALTNLSGRKPRGLGAAYGERASSAECMPLTEASFLVLKAVDDEVRERDWPYVYGGYGWLSVPCAPSDFALDK